MAKVGTATVEIRPVLSDDVLAAIATRIEEAVTAAVARGIKAGAQLGER